MLKDVFVEQLISCKNKKSAWVINLGIIIAVIIIIYIFSFVALLRPFVLVIAAGAIYGGYKLSKMQEIEYEYIFTNGDIDIDKIVSKSVRKHMLTVNTSRFESFSPINETNKVNASSLQNVYNYASSDDAENRWSATFNDGEKGRSVLILEPNEKMLEAITSSIPQRVIKK